MAAKFKKGDIVQLKSGGPPMTVANPQAYVDEVTCVWFAGAKREEVNFEQEVLQTYDAPAKK